MDVDVYVHIVMDAYHGDVVTLPGKVTVPSSEPGPAAAGKRAAGAQAAGEPVITVRLEAGAALPVQPEAEGWHLRFIGPRRAVDARSSDGTLAELRWEDHALTARVRIAEIAPDLDVDPAVAARRVTHVLVVPERDKG